MGAECFIAVLFQIKYNLVPSIIQLQRHRTLEWFDSRDGLLVARDECALDILIIQNSDLKSKIFMELRYLETYIFEQ